MWLHVGTLLDGASAAPVRDAHVVYDAGAIRFVGGDGATPPRHAVRPGQTRPDVEAPQFTLLPGLIEAHAHLAFEGGEIDPARRAAALSADPALLIARAADRLSRLVRLGVVAVRDAGDRRGVGLALRSGAATDDMRADGFDRPYVESPGAAIHHAGRYGAFMGEPAEQYATPAECVDARIAAGADRIKLIASGIIDFAAPDRRPSAQMTADEVGAYVCAARARGLQTFAHASGEAGIEAAIEGGVDSVEHGFFISDDQLARMRDRRIAWVPTFAPVHFQLERAVETGATGDSVAFLRRILDAHAEQLRRAHALGVIVIAGSDAGSVGVPHGYGLLDELALMERAGLSPIAVINAATGASATRFGFRRPFGMIAAGQLSRFILTHHSPLETVANLRRARRVVFDGTVHDVEGDCREVGM